MYYGEWIAFGTADIPVLFAPTTGTINYTICDLNGRLLLSDKKEVTSATNIPIDVQSLAKGMYIIHLIYNNNPLTIKMMVE